MDTGRRGAGLPHILGLALKEQQVAWSAFRSFCVSGRRYVSFDQQETELQKYWQVRSDALRALENGDAEKASTLIKAHTATLERRVGVANVR